MDCDWYAHTAAPMLAQAAQRINAMSQWSLFHSANLASHRLCDLVTVGTTGNVIVSNRIPSSCVGRCRISHAGRNMLPAPIFSIPSGVSHARHTRSPLRRVGGCALMLRCDSGRLTHQVKSMLRFLPVVWLDDELHRGQCGGGTHQRPIDGKRKHPWEKIILLALRASDETQIDVEEVAHDKTDHRWIENRRAIEHVKLGGKRPPFRQV